MLAKVNPFTEVVKENLSIIESSADRLRSARFGVYAKVIVGIWMTPLTRKLMEHVPMYLLMLWGAVEGFTAKATAFFSLFLTYSTVLHRLTPVF